MRVIADAAGRLLDRLIAVAKWLVIPVFLLLFLQWPLRDLIAAYSREANDLGQWLFALYVAVAVTAATRAGTHLAADQLAHRYSATTRRRLARTAAAVAVLPWAAFLAVSAKPTVLSSIGYLERFPDSGNPGYFVIKLAVWLLAGTMLLEAVADLFGPGPSGGDRR